MKTALLLVLLAAGLAGTVAVLWTPEETVDTTLYPVPTMPPEVLLVVDSADPYALRVAEQVRTVLTRTRVPFAEHDLASGNPLPDLAPLAAVLTAAERLREITDADADRLAAWVEQGGGLAVLYRGWSPRLADLFGIAPGDGLRLVDRPETLRTAAPLMPGADALALATGMLSAYDLQPLPECTSLADRQRDGRTVASGGWTCARGRGRVVYWNHVLFGTKVFRGHIVQSLALVHPAHARPLARWAVVWLDDFPAPASNAPVEPVWSRSGQTPAQFYADTWYPDMVALAEETGLRYTSTVIYAYNGRTTAPFPVDEWLAGRVQRGGGDVPVSPWIMSEDATRSEVAFHGYNHQSLLVETWQTQARMEQGLRAARARWEAEGLAEMPRSYVPPMNRIDSVGVAALRAVFPEITTVASTYTGLVEQGEGRDFGPEPWAPELYALPRTTAGFVFTDAERLKMLSALQTVGVWNHFVHPDELYDNADREATYAAEGLPSPSTLGWNDTDDSLLPSLRRWVGFAQTHYPWLDGLTAEDAATRMRAFDQLEIAWAATPGPSRTLALSASRSGQTLVTWARPGERLADAAGATVLDTWEGPLLTQIVLRLDGPQATLTFDSTLLP